MARDPYYYRDIPFRPPREEHQAGNLMQLGRRYLGTYILPHRGMLVGAMVFLLLASNTGYVITYATKYMVDDILVIVPGVKHTADPMDADRPPAATPIGSAPAVLQGMPSQGVAEAAATSESYMQGSERQLWTAFAMLIGAIVVLNLCSRMSSRLQVGLSIRSCAHLRRDLHKKILSLDYLNISNQTPGRLMSNILTDVTSMQAFFVHAVSFLVVEILIISFGICILFYLNWQMALIAGALLPLHGYLYHSLRSRMTSANREARHTNSCLWQFTTQRLNGIKTVMAYVQERREFLNFFRLTGAMARDALLQQRYVAVINSNALFISGIAGALVYVLGTRLILQQQMAVGDMLMFYGVVTFLFSHVLVLTGLNDQFNQVAVVLNRLYNILDMPVYIEDKPGAVALPEPVTGRVRFDDVTFSYPSAEQPSLANINLDIKPGEWVCIMGQSGAGKSTFVSLLTRLVEPSSGAVRIDDLPLSNVTIASLRRTMVLVPQEPQIFSGTVADNITYGGDEYSPRQIMDAARAAELHEFIMELPGKYETILGEKGVSLSGGQRQRLSLARALITNPRILILDDCTSALDASTERRIQDTLGRIMENRTAIIVSQRVSMASRCDRIVVLHRGRVTEVGTHQELIANDAFYAQLHRRQTMVEDTLEKLPVVDPNSAENPA